ncbi:S8 family serine peptidase [Lentilitoribacter sp. Alg239-R112]|uniref:S8 family serine peptidase n=1 Tax=Lentilitoribacter sp. Alg239-R112 TaxID=2305987 RepID=UPI0013A6C700|nr:S8 family serine peptidase [Lentilitoribacter sp. Alg239-R112]
MNCIHRLLLSLLVVVCFVSFQNQASAEQASLSQETFDWRQEVISRDEVQRELARLYVLLHEKNALPTRLETIQSGDRVSDVLIRAGAWPKWLTNYAPEILDSLLCDLNADICDRKIRSASQKDSVQDLATISGTVVSTGNWAGAWPGRKMIVPDVELKLDYDFGVRSKYELSLSKTEAVFEQTSDFLQLFCRKFPNNKEHCRSRIEKGAWEAEEPVIYRFIDDGNADLNRYEAIANPSFLRKIGTKDSDSWLVAIPTLDVDLAIESIKLESLVGDSDQFSQRVLIQRSAKTESLEKSMLSRRLMGLIEDNGKPFRSWQDGLPIRPIRIVHVDEEAQLDHCIFRQFVQSGQLKLKRWTDEGTFETVVFPPMEPSTETSSSVHSETTDIPHEVASSDTNGANTPLVQPVSDTEETDVVEDAIHAEPTIEMSDCGNYNPVVLAQGNHGTHTLGLLADLALAMDPNLPITPNPQIEEPPVTIYHIAVPNGPEKTRALTDTIKSMAIHGPDLVNISLSWPRSGSTPLVDAIKQYKRNVLFVAPAGTGDEDVSCSIVPACIQSDNVISVVALDHQEDGTLSILPGTNIGAAFHEIGAIGADLVAPVAGDQMGALSGTSQAAPVVTSVVSYLMRMGIRDFKQIKRRLVTTAILDSDLLHASSATLINARLALDFAHDFVRLADGCEMRGRFDNLSGDDEIRSKAKETGTSEHRIEVTEILRIFYNSNADTRLIMDMPQSKLRQQNYRLKDDDLDRKMNFKAEFVKNCSTRAAGSFHNFPLRDVRDFIKALE